MKIDMKVLGDVVVFGIEGSVTGGIGSAAGLGELLKNQLEAGTRKIVIDMSQATSIGSVAVGDVLKAYISIVEAGSILKIVVSEEDFATIVRFPDHLPIIYGSLEDALAAFKTL